MRNFILFFLLSLLTLDMHSQKNTFDKPNLNYPKGVLLQAEKQIANAATLPAPEAGIQCLNGMLKGLEAMRRIDPDNIDERIRFIHKNGAAGYMTAADRSLVAALEAMVLKDYRDDNRWKINSREVPGDPATPSLWSQSQFDEAIDALYKQAGALAAKVEVKQFIPNVLTPGDTEIFNTLGAVYNDWEYTDTTFSTQCTPGSPAFFYWFTREKMDRTGAYEWLDEWEKYRSYEWSNYMLLEGCMRFCPNGIILPNTPETEGNQIRERFVKACNEGIKAHPGFPYNAFMELLIQQATAPTVNLNVNNYVPVGRAFEITLTGYNAKKILVDFCPATTNRMTESAVKNLRAARSLALKSDSIYSTFHEEVTLEKAGLYVVRMKVNDDASVRYSYIQAVPFVPMTVYLNNEGLAITTDYQTGAPVAGVRVFGADKKANFLGSTGKEGSLRFARWKEYNSWRAPLHFTYGAQNFDFNDDITVSFENPRKANREVMVNVLTDRAVYHPGETVSWAVIVGTREPAGTRHPAEDMPVTVTLKSPNYEEVATIDVRTEKMGRVDGTFTIPVDGLTGEFTVTANARGNDGSARIMVSDFKAPVFEVKIDSLDVTPKRVKIQGVATTLSGMPVADAEVALKVESGWYWRRNADESLYRSTSVTGADGRFEFIVDADSISGSDFQPSLSAQITVTTKAGETAEATRMFTFRLPYNLTLDVNAGKYSTAKPFDFTVTATDANGEAGELKYEWQLRRHNETVLKGNATTGEKVSANIADLEADEYNLIVKPEDSTKAGILTRDGFIFYNVAKNAVPKGDAIFLIDTSLSVPTNEREVKLTVGTAEESIYLYAVVADANGLHFCKLEEMQHGFITLQLPLSDDKPQKIILLTQKNGVTSQEEVEIARTEPQKIEIQVESFRDKVVPGNTETWRLRITGPDAAGAAAVATMYNYALEKLTFYRAGVDFRFLGGGVFPSTSVLYQFNYGFEYHKSVRIREKSPNFDAPQFQYLSLNASRNLRMRGRMMYSRGKYESMDFDVEEEKASDDAMMLSAAPQANAVSYETRAIGNSKYNMPESAMTTEGEVEADDSETTPAGDEYREPEVLQAFWMPRLVADEEGVVTIEFTVPKANTTWAFKMFGWTSELLAARFDATTLASKPVMVQSAVPRYLRQGDQAILRATVFNNTDSAATVTTLFEVFNPASGEILGSATETLTLGAKESAVVSVPATGNCSLTAIGYRIKATAGKYTDGEQGVLPILESSQILVESQEFYLDAQGGSVALKAPTAKDAQTTLQYCQNPIWTVVKALRGIQWKDCRTATEAASQLGSAALARHILKSNPRIEGVLAQWKANPDSKALTSMLEQNSELKTLLLNQTPWVQAAKNNTERMQALAEVLDSTRCAYYIRQTKDVLNKLQNQDGGFKWISWDGNKSSAWVTINVLSSLGIVNSFGALPEEIIPIAKEAFTWLQGEAVNNRKNEWLGDQLAFISTLFPAFQLSEGGKAVVNATVTRLAKDWGKMNLSDKAYTAMILNRHGKETPAQDIIRSIEQFGQERPGRGLEFPSVRDIRAYGNIIQAVATVTPGNPILDKMRQWVIIQAQATDDLGAWNPDYVITSVLLTGTVWADMTSVQPITIDGKPATFAGAELGTGYLTAAIAPGSTVGVTSTGVTPSYGSLVSLFTAPMANVKAHKGDDVEITKRMMVLRDGKWVETTEYRFGEEVKVQLQIKTKRNLEYVAITDERPAGFEPREQLPGWLWSNGISFYRENRDASTRIFIGYLPKGSYSLTYSMTAATEGTFASGVATLQSQYDPALTAHSGGTIIQIR